MARIAVSHTSSEKDIGVYIQDDLKPSLHCTKIATKANAMLGQLSRAVSYRDKETFIRLYIVYIRPILEYCIQAVGPYTVADRVCLEKVQMRAVQMVSNIGSGSYEEKLQILGLTTLEERRWRGDMIQTWRILTGKDNVKSNIWFDLEVDRPRVGASNTRFATQYQALRPRKFYHEQRGKFFSNRVVQDYNSLPDYVKRSETINMFKNNLDHYRGTPCRPSLHPLQ